MIEQEARSFGFGIEKDKGFLSAMECNQTNHGRRETGMDIS